jgi:hypothetical protein
MEDTRPLPDLIYAVTYDETSEQFEERIIALVEAQMQKKVVGEGEL